MEAQVSKIFLRI